MAIYQFINTNTEFVWTQSMRMSELEGFLKANPNIQIHYTPDTLPATVLDPLRLSATRKGHLDSGFKEVLQKIHKESPGSDMGNTSSQL